MASDWAQPTLGSPYADFLQILKAQISDCATFNPAGSNIIPNSMRWERTANLFQEFIGGVWTNKVLSVAGGGTGSTNSAGIVTSLGLGTMALQNANNVNITGGVLAGNGAGLTNLNASNISSGTLPGSLLPNPLPALNGGNLFNLNAGALAFGIANATVLGTGATGAGLKFLADNGTWKSVGMAQTSTYVTVTLPAGNTSRVTVAIARIADVTKAYIAPQTGLIRNQGTTTGVIAGPATAYFSSGPAGTGAVTVVTTGPADFVTVEGASDGNSPLQSYLLALISWV